jgi:hypothetical protein
VTARLDCGHQATPRGGSTGVAWRPDGTSCCLPCAAVMERAALVGADRTVVYLSVDNRRVTGWAGNELGAVTWFSDSRAAHKVYVRVTDVHGQRWVGQGPRDSGTYVRLRRVAGADQTARGV